MGSIHMQGKIHRRNGNQPIDLTDPQQVWVVISGSVAIFAIDTNRDCPTSQRQYLWTIEADRAMFGATVTDLQLLAVPLGSAELLELDPDCWHDLCAHQDPRPQLWLETWLDCLAPLLSPPTRPDRPLLADPSAHYSLVDRQNLQINTSCWLEIQSGRVCLADRSEIAIEAAALPLPHDLYLSALGEVQIATHPLNQIPADTLLAGLSHLHAWLFESIGIDNIQHQQQDLSRLADRDRLDRQLTINSLETLAGTLPAAATYYPSLGGDPLLAVVGAVGRSLGMEIRPPAMSDRASADRDPQAAIIRASRLRQRRVLLRDRWWEQDHGALIAYTKVDRQPIALLPIKNNRRYQVYNPTQPELEIVTAQLAAQIDPVAYMLYRSLPDRAIRAIDALKFALKGRQSDILTIIFTAVMVALLGLVVPHATLMIMDNAIPDSDRGLLLQIGLGLLVAAVGTALFQLTQGFSLLRLETITDHSTQSGIWDRLLNLPAAFFREYTTGDLQSRVSSVNAIRRQLSGRNLINLISGLFTIFYLAQLFYYSYELALLAVGVAVVTILVTTLAGMLLLSKVRPLLEIRGEIFGQTVQMMNGIAKLHIAGAQDRAFAAWSRNFTRQVKLELSTQTIEDLVVVYNTILPIASSGLLFWLAIRMLDRPQAPGAEALTFTFGTFLAFNAAFGSFTRGSMLLSNTIVEVLQVVPQWQRTQPILQSVPEIDRTKADPGRLSGRIEIDRVTFRYQPDAPLILDNISIQAKPGEFIALVGASGSGKSTILRLLLGFETPQTGTVFYDGQDLSGLDVDAVRRQLGVVLQHGQLTAASIFDNIAGGGLVTLDEAWAAARMAGLAEDIEQMPMQMHTIVSEGGGNISGGQRQRLSIARALVHKPRILLFDEATSALDNHTQAIVSQSLERLQVTRIVIAHRLSTIQNADRIYVLEGGKPIQQGKFAELAADANGLFARLMARQATRSFN